MALKKNTYRTETKSSGHMFGNIANVVKVAPSAQSYSLLMDEITFDSVKGVIEWIIEANFAEEKPQHLTLLCCSPGGYLSAAFALVDIMRGSNIPISTVGLGEVASAGMLIVMSGTKGLRFCTNNTSLLSHQYTAGAYGKHHELVSAIKEHELVSRRIIDHYSRCTGLDEKKIRDILLPPSDVYLTPAEAKKYGIVDHIKDLN